MRYVVKTFRDAGLEAKWSRTRKGAPAIFARDPEAKTSHQREKWWLVSKMMFEAMQAEGIREGFNSCTIFGDMFSIPA